MTVIDLQRHGRIDAVIRLVLSRRFGAHVTAEDWCQILDVTPAEVRAELERRRHQHRTGRILAAVPPLPPEEAATEPVCPTCGAEFGDMRALAAHRKTHRAKVPCPICGKPCTPPAGLTRHVRQSHPKESA